MKIRQILTRKSSSPSICLSFCVKPEISVNVSPSKSKQSCIVLVLSFKSQTSRSLFAINVEANLYAGIVISVLYVLDASDGEFH